MKGYTYLKYGLDGELEPKTIIRTEHISEYESFDGTKDYDYYIFENDNMFHRCNKDGKLGAKYQDRFLNYKVLNKEFELYGVLKEPQEHKIPEKLEDISEIKCVGCKVEINIAGNKTLFDPDTPIVTEHCIYKINQLIKNQKKILDYLEVNDEI